MNTGGDDDTATVLRRLMCSVGGVRGQRKGKGNGEGGRGGEKETRIE